MFGCSVEPHPVRSGLVGVIAQREEQQVLQVDVSKAKNSSHRGAQGLQFVDDERKRNAFS